MGNYLYHGTKQVLLIEGDEAELLCETRIDISSEMKGLDPESFPGRCHLVKKLEEDDLFNAWDDVPQDELNLFLEIIGIRTNFKDAIPLRDAGVPRVAMIFLFLFAGKNVKLPSDDLLEKYQRHARVYSLHLRGHSDDEIGKIVGLRKVHITRIISSVKQTLGNTNGYNKIPEEPPGAASQSE